MAELKRVLITGASGYIGGACATELLARGWEVHGFGRSAPAEDVGHAWHTGDFFDGADRRRVLGAVQPSHVLHLAWEARPGVYLESPDNERWAEASLAFLTEAQAAETLRIVGVGSCLEYGDFSAPCREDASGGVPITAYGRAKRAAGEAFAAADAAWARLFFPFGPGEPEGKLIPSLIKTLRAGDNFRCATADLRRDFIYVDDVADGLAALLNSPVRGAINLGAGEARTLGEVVGFFAGRLGGADRVIYGSLQRSMLDSTPVIVANTLRLAQEVGWSPRIGWERGAQRSLDWWVERLR